MTRHLRFAGFSFLLLCLFTLGASAQSQITTGTIVTTVTDSSGAVVPGASVTVANVDTGFERSGSTDGNGRFVAPQLPPGNYSVTVTQSGFATMLQEDVVVTVGQSLSFTIALQ